MNSQEVLAKNKDRIRNKSISKRYISPNISSFEGRYKSNLLLEEIKRDKLLRIIRNSVRNRQKQKGLYNQYLINKRKLNSLLFNFPPGPIYINLVTEDGYDINVPYLRGMSFINFINSIYNFIPDKYPILLITYDEGDDEFDFPIRINNLIDLFENFYDDIFIKDARYYQ